MYKNIIILVIIGLTMLLGIMRGYKVGFVKGVAALISLVFSVIIFFITRAILASLSVGQGNNAFISIIVLVVLGLLYSILKRIFGALKIISALPIIGFFNRVLGMALGMAWIVVLWTAIYLILGV